MSFKAFTFFLIIGLISSAFANQDIELKNIESALIEFQEIKSESIPKILIYSKASGFAHKSIPTGVKALRALALKTKAFDPYFTNNAEDFSADNLSNFDGLNFNNTARV